MLLYSTCFLFYLISVAFHIPQLSGCIKKVFQEVLFRCIDYPYHLSVFRLSQFFPHVSAAVFCLQGDGFESPSLKLCRSCDLGVFGIAILMQIPPLLQDSLTLFFLVSNHFGRPADCSYSSLCPITNPYIVAYFLLEF